MILPLVLKSTPKMISTEVTKSVPDPNYVRSWIDKILFREPPLITRKFPGKTEYNKVIIEGSMVRGKVLEEVSLGGFIFYDLKAIETRGRPNLWTCGYSHFDPDHMEAKPSTY